MNNILKFAKEETYGSNPKEKIESISIRHRVCKPVKAELESNIAFECPNCDTQIIVKILHPGKDSKFTGIKCDGCDNSYSLEYTRNPDESEEPVFLDIPKFLRTGKD